MTVYADNAATTRMSRTALDAMLPAMEENYGNPSSLHSVGQRAAELFASALREIYPLPDQVTTRSTTTLAEVRSTKAPTVLLEIGYHDNAADAQWIAEHINLIAQTLVQAMTEYFGLPYVYPGPSQPGLAVTDSGGPVNLRAYPSAEGQVLTQIPSGATVTVFGQYQGWYVVLYNDTIGYANSAFIRL